MDLATVDKLLTTTRSVRRRLDLTRLPDAAVIEECLEIAVQAPQGSNNCRYHFIVVTDPGKRRALADLYRLAFEQFTRPRAQAGRPCCRATWTPGSRWLTISKTSRR